MRMALKFLLASLIFMAGGVVGGAVGTFIWGVPTVAYYIIGWVASAAFSLTIQDKE